MPSQEKGNGASTGDQKETDEAVVKAASAPWASRTLNHIRMQFPSQPRYVATIRDTLYRFATQHGFSRQGAFDLKIVAGEALSNIIKHAYQERSDRPIFIDLLFFPEHVEVRFRDMGRQVPLRELKMDLSDYRESGLGLFLIDKLSDYHYFDQSDKAGTTLIVKKKVC